MYIYIYVPTTTTRNAEYQDQNKKKKKKKKKENAKNKDLTKIMAVKKIKKELYIKQVKVIFEQNPSRRGSYIPVLATAAILRSER